MCSVSLSTCLYVYIYIYIYYRYIYIYIYTHMHTYTYMYIHIHIYSMFAACMYLLFVCLLCGLLRLRLCYVYVLALLLQLEHLRSGRETGDGTINCSVCLVCCWRLYLMSLSFSSTKSYSLCNEHLFRSRRFAVRVY